MKAILFTLLFCFCNAILKDKTPIVIVHGILSSAEEMLEAKMWFTQNLEREVFTIEIGNGKLDSIFLPMEMQIDLLSKTIQSIPPLQSNIPFHIIGFSQGGLLARAYAQKSKSKNIKTLMTFGTPHMGVYYYSDESIYSEKTQSKLSYSNYWKDPYMYALYLDNCTFLPMLNGEKKSKEEKMNNNNLYDRVDKFVMMWSEKDEVIRPIESGKYEFYEKNSQIIIPFLESESFKNNLIGIRKLYEENRLFNVKLDCGHREFKNKECLEKYKNEILSFLE